MEDRKAQEFAPWIIFVTAVAVMFFRMPERFIDGFLWAEDGPRMIQEVYEHGRFSLFATFPGYAVLIPKIISGLTMKLVPLSWVPWVFVYAMAAVWAAMCSFTFAVASRWLNPIAAVALALFPVLAPHGGEVFLNLTNLQWLIAPCLAACLWSAAKENAYHPALLGSMIFLLSCTGPFSVLMAPFAAVLVAVYRPARLTVRELCFVIAYAIPVLFQAWHMYKFGTHHQEYKDLPWVDEFTVHAISDQFLGRYVTEQLSEAAPWVGASLFVLSLVVVLCTRARILCMACIAFAIIGWALAMHKLNTPGVHLVYNGSGSRYVYPISVAMFSALVLSAAETRVCATKIVSASLGALLLLNGMNSFAIPRPDITWTYSQEGDIKRIVVPPAAVPGQAPWEARIRITRGDESTKPKVN